MGLVPALTEPAVQGIAFGLVAKEPLVGSPLDVRGRRAQADRFRLWTPWDGREDWKDLGAEMSRTSGDGLGGPLSRGESWLPGVSGGARSSELGGTHTRLL